MCEAIGRVSIGQKCILCDCFADRAAVFHTEKTEFGAIKGKTRLISYAICSSHDVQDNAVVDAIEEILKAAYKSGELINKNKKPTEN